MAEEAFESGYDIEEASFYFDKVCELRRPDGKPLNQHQIGALLQVNQSTISRNKKLRKKGKNITDDFSKVVASVMMKQWETQQLQEQREAEIAAEAQRLADCQEEQERMREQREAELEQRRMDELACKADDKLRNAVFKRLEPYWAVMRDKGILIGDDPTIYGDAPDLLAKARPEEIEYLNFEIAAIALAPAGYQFACGFTAAQLRWRITAWQRLAGQYPVKMREMEGRVIGDALPPDAKLRYPREYRELIQDWQRMNRECRTLADKRLPMVVSLSDASKFRDFAAIHKRLRRLMYTLQRACLDDHTVETQLRRVNLATVPLVVTDGIMTGLAWATFGALVAAVSGTVLLAFGG